MDEMDTSVPLTLSVSESCHREWMLRAKQNQLLGPGEKVRMKA